MRFTAMIERGLADSRAGRTDQPRGDAEDHRVVAQIVWTTEARRRLQEIPLITFSKQRRW
jgi:hypothetical protein